VRKEQRKGKRGARFPKVKKGGHRNNSEYYDEADEESDGGGEEDEYDFEQDDIVKEIKRRYKVPKNVWIVKPGENTNRGNGINVSSTVSEIKQLVSQSAPNGYGAKEGSETKDKTFIVQKYIDNPLLINNRKFDFRCYGLLTSINGHLKGFFYEDAYIRTSCKEFDIERLDNKFIHLTNDAVQKNS
jgi:Tubulin-tyrosine ligase family